MICFKDTDDLQTAIENLTRLEPRFKTVVERHGMPSKRAVEPGLESLLRIVTDQLISLKAGEAIWRRLADRLSPFAPTEVLSVPLEDLKALGLSGTKARTFHACAAAFATGRYDHHNLSTISADSVLAMLQEIHGIGPWTAEIYLLTALQFADAWPAGDLALQIAAQDLLKLERRPTAKEMTHIANDWRPYRSAAALLLWSHYRGLKLMPQAAI